MSLRKRILAGFLGLSVLAVPGFAAAGPAPAAPPIYLNGRQLFLPEPPVNQANRLLVPLRGYLEAVGATVDWVPPRTVVAHLDGHTVKLALGSVSAQVDDRAVPLEVPAQLIDSRTYVPLRFVSEGLGAEVGYDGHSVQIETLSKGRAEVTEGRLNVRQSPDMKAPVITLVPVGTIFDVVQSGPDWTQVRLTRGQTGWVSSQYIRPLQAVPSVLPFQNALDQGYGFLQVNNQCLGVSPMLDSQFYLPLRDVMTQVGGQLTWTGTSALVTFGGHSADFTPGNPQATVDGRTTLLNGTPANVAGRLMVPARAFSDALGLPLQWDSLRRTATLTSLGGPAPVAVCNPAMPGESYVVMDANTGLVVSEYNADAPRQVASVTKTMTALLALEQSDPATMVTISWNAAHSAGVDGTNIALKTGEKLSLQDLLYGLILPSGNDAAVAIAEAIAGSEGNFVRLMNQRAAELGARNTYFQNASGLDDNVKPYSSARDLALVARAGLSNLEFRSLVSTPDVKIPGRSLTNHNLFLGSYAGAIGVKNGWTPLAGHTLIAAASHGDQELITVVLGAPDRTLMYKQAAQLMDQGFSMEKSAWIYRAMTNR